MIILLKIIAYFILVGLLTIICFRKHSALLFMDPRQLDLRRRHEKIAIILRWSILIFVIYTVLTFGVQSGFYLKSEDGLVRFRTLLFQTHGLGILKEYNDVVNAIFTTFVQIFTYIAYLLPSVYSTED